MFVTRLVWLSLLSAGGMICSSPDRGGGGVIGIAQVDSLWLTTRESSWCGAYDVAALRAAPDVLTLPITAVQNRGRQPVTLDVYFKSGDARWDVGNVSLFPADRPATFTIRASAAVSKVLADARATSPGGGRVSLCIEMRRVAAATPDTEQVRVRLARPAFSQLKK